MFLQWNELNIFQKIAGSITLSSHDLKIAGSVTLSSHDLKITGSMPIISRNI
jgi:hypothetical protein